MSEWVSVLDRLPENDDGVLIYNPKDGIGIGDYEADNVSWYLEDDGSKFYTDTGWNSDYLWAPYQSPTHWMNLPTPPKS